MYAVRDIVNDVQAKLPDAEVIAKDLTGGQDHYQLVVISDEFEGKTRLVKHKLVLDALRHVIGGPLHAVEIKPFTKSEWKELGE